MLLDLRIMFTASLAAVLLLIGGFGLIAALRTPGKPSVAILSGPAEITGSIRVRGEKSQSLTDEDKTAQPARPAQPAAEAARPAPEPVRTVNVDSAEKTQALPSVEQDRPAKAKRAAAKPKPRIRAARQETGANFRANNPLSFPFFGSGEPAN
jgi:hypothetical protein